MRTGGTYLLRQFTLNDWDVFNSWDTMKRDWTKAEAYAFVNKQQGLFHNHVVSWDYDTMVKFKRSDWSLFTIVRNPISQLTSLYNYLGNNPHISKSGRGLKMSLDEFDRSQVAGKPLLSEHNGKCVMHKQHWAIPDWHKKISIVIAYDKQNLRKNLSSRFAMECQDRLINNTNYMSSEMSEETKEIIRQDSCYEKYIELSKRIT